MAYYLITDKKSPPITVGKALKEIEMRVNDSTFKINRNHLKAVLRAAAKDDIRFSLNSVKVDFDLNGTTLSATNGHFLITIRYAATNNCVGSFLMPRQIAQRLSSGRLAVKGRNEIEVTVLDTENYIAEDFSLLDASIKFKAVEWIDKYPCFRTVIPTEISQEPAHFNPDYLYQINKAAGEAFGKSTGGLNVTMHQNGKEGACICTANESVNFIAVVMPIRIELTDNNNKTVYPNTFSLPSWVKGSKK